LSFQVGSSDLRIQGSPARVCGDGDAVFGSAAASQLDLNGCIKAMALHASKILNVIFPRLTNYTVTRVDVTGNLLLGSLVEVRDALRILRDCEGGRYRVSQQAGDSVYWSHLSKLRSGKAYAKGPHLEYLTNSSKYSGRIYTPAELYLAQNLLRLELKLGREFFARNDWMTMDADFFKKQWNEYFDRMIGDSEMKTDNDLKQKIFAVAPTEGRAKAAYGCWLLIQSEGWERARESYPKPTWYRHLSILRNAGCGDADISVGRVVPIRKKIIEARLISSWSQLKQAS
jgi:II/X family phage/plasmid replication protein